MSTGGSSVKNLENRESQSVIKNEFAKVELFKAPQTIEVTLNDRVKNISIKRNFS